MITLIISLASLLISLLSLGWNIYQFYDKKGKVNIIIQRNWERDIEKKLSFTTGYKFTIINSTEKTKHIDKILLIIYPYEVEQQNENLNKLIPLDTIIHCLDAQYFEIKPSEAYSINTPINFFREKYINRRFIQFELSIVYMDGKIIRSKLETFIENEELEYIPINK